MALEVHQPDTSLPEVQERRLVIAIDYGTTYTGIAYTTPVGNRAVLKDIKVVQVWGNRMRNQDKVPSVISYSLKSKNLEQQWGEDLSPNAVAMIHTKLQLDVDDTEAELDLILQALDGMHDLDFQYIKASGGESNFPRTSPEDIVEDYLKKVFGHLRKTVDRFTPVFVQTTPVDVVATVPAEWTYRAKNSTFRALTRAGFNTKNFPELRDMLLISEPEAAAVYTARYLTERNGTDFLEKDECFILCDAGGGTVDVVSYKVKQLHPKFEIEPVTVPTGDKCGSVFIDLAFKKWLKELVGEDRYQELDEFPLKHKITSHDAEGKHMRKLMQRFDMHKRKFIQGNRDMKMEFSEGSPLENLDIPDKVDAGEFTISYETMRSFFEPRATRIVELIVGQYDQLQDKRHEVQNVFLVGGFARSPYLQQSINESLQMRGLDLHIPDTSWTAVVSGAAIFGVEKVNNASISMKACPRSYGVSVHVPFSDVENRAKDKEDDPITGNAVAKDQLMWLIKKGDLILSNEPKEVTRSVTMQFKESSPKTGSILIYAYDRDKLPTTLVSCEQDLTKFHNLEYDMTSVPPEEFARERIGGSNVLLYTAELKLTMRLAPRVLMVKLSLGNRVVYTRNVADPLLLLDWLP